MPLLVLDDGDHVERHQVADDVVCLVDLDIQNALVVQRLPLDHLSVVDADCQEQGIHHLADDELRDLVVELLRDDHKKHDPADHVNQIGDHEVLQHHVPHEEDQAQSQLDLQLVEASSSPLTDVLGLEGQQHQEHDNAVN